MDILKTPHEKLMEEAGVNPASPGWLNTPKQMLMQEAGTLPTMASGGNVEKSPQDMLAELFINNIAPEHFKDGGHAKSALEKLKEFFKRLPMPQTAALGANLALGGPDLIENHKALQENLQGGKYGSAATNAIDMGTALSPYFMVPSMYNTGKYLSEVSTGQLAHNPAYRKQMQDVSSSPLGGALSGDAGLAAQILGQQEYAPDDEGKPSILYGTTLPKK